MATINVTTTVDENNGTGAISLREAVIKANATAGDDTIVLGAGKTYKLTLTGVDEDKSAKGDLDILSSGGKITILAQGGKATIDAGGVDGVFDVKEKGSLELRNTIVTGGKGQQIYSPYFGTTFETGGEGITISSGGNLKLVSSKITGNTGGGIHNYNGTVNVIRSNISNNGDIYAISNSGRLKIINSKISGNEGIGIKNNAEGALIVQNSSITNNADDGISDSGNSSLIQNTTISGNGRNGVDISFGNVKIINSTISSNSANGISNDGSTAISSKDSLVNITNSTIGGNKGAGIGNYDGTINLKNTTVTGNINGGVVNKVYNTQYTFVLYGKVNFSNSIIAKNQKNRDIIADTNNTSIKNSQLFVSQGNNLIGNATGVTTIFSQTGDKKGTATAPLDPKLGLLQNNGGRTRTHALLAGSPAINAGKTTVQKDQRGYGRNGVPDIGAFEYSGISVRSAQTYSLDKLTNNDNLINGRDSNDTLIGGSSNDTFLVNPGNDILTGGAGADKFTYNTNAKFAKTAVGLDTITDFVIAQGDKIVLDKTTFPKITSTRGTGFSINSEFAKVTTNAAAATSAADIVYNSATGGLFYNQNGTVTGFGTGGQFLTLTNKPALTASQFIIQA